VITQAIEFYDAIGLTEKAAALRPTLAERKR
jgi:hypothetical protein